ncbi:adenylosuccinate synthetase [Williamsoniiplasma somnilux]|uniref:Adenylosuccinate synthetase n=1 Tax=Williamsoniiplasma somnilux TaxID=215578 RepID=A0A2K8NX85_9MOLU|nr:adenylosuccinate synthase [Williamsoniiplasma somnilux]ATZ18452.1 adenylosuccinate synthetase [Williamsoniiplasma somnilux]
MKKAYKSLVVVGTQWGDEGKGKITDYFAQKADMVVRFAGGDNAGHMIEFNGKRHKVTIVPSGIFSPKVKNVIGNGTVVNLEKLDTELTRLKNDGIKIDNLFISDRAHVIFDYHCKIDELQEEARKENRIGTTKRGIGPTYMSKASRYGIRICDFNQPNFKAILEENVEHHNGLIRDLYKSNETFSFNEIYSKVTAIYNKYKNQIVDSGEMVSNAIQEGQYVLFEGAQGVLLDIDHGTYPFVTSSNCTANNASTGVGIHAKEVQKVVGVVKAYNTRVGTGGMPTELFDETGNRIRERGREYGSNTGRPRRCGWLDLVALKYAIRVGGIDELFLTLFDVLDQEKEIKICVGYKLNGKEMKSMPASDQDLRSIQPIYQTLPGWNEDITNVKSFADLPQNAKNYLTTIVEFTNTPFLGFSVGPDRTQTILIKEEFND